MVFLEGSGELSWHALVLALTMSSLLSSTAVLNMDNTVVDLETLQALYENVSISNRLGSFELEPSLWLQQS